MKSSFIRVISLILVCASPGGSAYAADTPGQLPSPIIALVDVQRILQESLAAISVQKQMEVYRLKFQNITESEENSLRQSENNLSKSRVHLTADMYADREQQLRQRVLAVESRVEARRKMLDQTFKDSMNIVSNGMLEIVNAVAHERGVNLVLVKQQAFWVDKSLDVTDIVLGRLNKKMPELNVNMALDVEAEDKDTLKP